MPAQLSPDMIAALQQMTVGAPAPSVPTADPGLVSRQLVNPLNHMPFLNQLQTIGRGVQELGPATRAAGAGVAASFQNEDPIPAAVQAYKDATAAPTTPTTPPEQLDQFPGKGPTSEPDEPDYTSDEFMAQMGLMMETPKQLRGGPSSSELDKRWDEMQALGEQQVEMARAAGEKQASVIDQMLEIQQGTQIELQELQQRAQEAEAGAMQKLEEARLLRKHGGLNLEEIRSYQETLASPDATPEQRQAAQRALDKAEEPDPGRYWEKKGTVGKILAAISIIAGAKVQSLTNQAENPAMKLINEAIDRDLALQAQKFRKRGYAVRDAQNYVQMVSRQFDREEDRLLAAKTLMMEDLKLASTRLEATSGSTQKVLAIQQNVAQMGANIEQNKMQLRQSARLQQQRMDHEARMQRNQMRFKLGMERMKSAGANQPIKLNYATLDNPSKMTADAVKKAKELDNTYSDGKRSIERLIALRKEHGFVVLDRKVVREMRQLKAELVDVIRSAKNWGAKFEKSEEEMIASLLGSDDPTDMGFIQHSLEGFERWLDNHYEKSISNYGGTPNMASFAPEGVPQ